MRIAIITARGGSKRIPRKNARPFLGKPMLAWPIETAKASGCFERILVSTDDPEIADIARQYGADVPFTRPAELSNDYALAHHAARHALEWAIKEWGAVEAFCHIYPTAPTLTENVLRECMDNIEQKGFKAAWVVTQVPAPIYQVMVKGQNGGMSRLFPEEKVAMRSQDMPAAFIDVGQAYAFETDHFLRYEMALGDLVSAVEVPFEAAIDIDTEEDWQRAERFVKAQMEATRKQ